MAANSLEDQGPELSSPASGEGVIHNSVLIRTHEPARISHAWVMWQHEGRWFILDCTMNSAPIAADKVGNNDYVPLYSFSKGVEYRHSGNAGSVATVAGKSRTPVAQGDRLAAAN